MKRALAALLITVAPAAFADDAEIGKGLENLQNIFGIAHVLEIHRVLGTTMPAEVPILDPWGTTYRIGGFRTAAAFLAMRRR